MYTSAWKAEIERRETSRWGKKKEEDYSAHAKPNNPPKFLTVIKN